RICHMVELRPKQNAPCRFSLRPRMRLTTQALQFRLIRRARPCRFRTPPVAQAASQAVSERQRREPLSTTKGSRIVLTILGQNSRYCDGISRRSFLKIGALGLGAGGLTLSDLYRAEARAGTGSGHKSVINIFLGGGPPHQDMWDIKAAAPVEIRGEFKPIATAVPGL